ncbi:MAG: insulinase family protein [Anaeromyxobacter sp.]|nr:insulinase family protein [Anaeromyxobacter sp.]
MTRPVTVGARVLELDAVRATTLSNGLRLRILAEASSPTVSYSTVFQVGSRNERPGITGISHLFEHMMFNGAARYGPKEFDRVLEGKGGHSNAFTSNDLTVYYEDFGAEALETVVDLESDRMGALRLDDAALEQEREVVKEERRLRTDDSVFGLMEEQLESLVFQAHPYRWPVIGWMDDIQRISRQDCQDFFRTCYAPSNAAIYLVGDVDPDAAAALVERFYGALPAGPPLPPVAAGEPDQRGERRAEIRFPAQAPALLVGWRGPAARSPDAAALDLAQVCLAVGEASRLRRILVHEKALVVSVQASFAWRIDPGVFLVSCELAPGAKVAGVERALFDEVARLGARGPTARELARARALLRSAVLHDLGTHHGLAQALGQAEALLGDWREAGRTLEHYEAVGAADVKRVVARYLDPALRSVVTLVPGATR